MCVEFGLQGGAFFVRDLRGCFCRIPWPWHFHWLFALTQESVLHRDVQDAGKHGVHGHRVGPALDGGMQVRALLVEEALDQGDGTRPANALTDLVGIEAEPGLKVEEQGGFVLPYEVEEPSNSPRDAPNLSPTASIHFIVNFRASAESRRP